MWCRLSIAGAAALMMGVAGTTAAELPTYEVMGFPITPHQLVALGPARAQQGLSAFALALAASPHQLAVLTPRQRPTEQIASSGERMPTGLVRLSPAAAIKPAR